MCVSEERCKPLADSSPVCLLVYRNRKGRVASSECILQAHAGSLQGMLGVSSSQYSVCGTLTQMDGSVCARPVRHTDPKAHLLQFHSLQWELKFLCIPREVCGTGLQCTCTQLVSGLLAMCVYICGVHM